MTFEDIVKNISGTKEREHIATFQTWQQIRDQVLRAEKNSRPAARKLKKFFQKQNDLETCEAVWKWIRKNIPYKAEPSSDQTAKTIERFIVDREGDCKHYATMCVAILNQCNIPAWFGLACQHLHRPKNPNHIYCIAKVNNKIVYVDPCRRVFNTECLHYYKYNVAPKP